MEIVICLCIYLGYTGDGYAVAALNENDEYLYLNLRSGYGAADPAVFFENLPYGSMAKLTLQRQQQQYNLGNSPGAGGGAMQYEYSFQEASLVEDFQSELNLSGEAFSVYSRDNGKRIQLRLDTIRGRRITAGSDLVSRPDWFFVELENYAEFSDDDYNALYAAWKEQYAAGGKLNLSVTLRSQTEEFRNVWAPSASSTVKNYWIITGMSY